MERHMMKRLILLAAGALSCAAYGEEVSAINATANLDKQFQTIESFTASDAWSGNFIGKFFADDKKEKLAKWLFSQKYGEDGSPEGIGLSMWRINIGGGTWEQEGADIFPIQRRAESFLTKDGKKYDWSKAAGQQWFMKKAKELGCESFLLFSNTPPVQMTQNSKGYKDAADFKSNLRPDMYDDFAEYMATVAKHFVDEGYNVDYISPVNEPSWKWTTDIQEGTPWLNPEIKKLAVELDKSLTKRRLATKIFLSEADSIQNIYGYDRVAKGNPNKREDMAYNQLYAFFNPASKDYIGNLKTLARQIGAHSYHTHLRNSQMRDVRKKAAAEAEKYGVEFHQTEWCMLGFYANPKKLDGFTMDWKSNTYNDMQTALHMAKIIYSDLVYGQAHSWSYWVASEIRDGICALIDAQGFVEDARKGRDMRPTKLLWALGNYSFFIRPGYDRVEIAGADNMDGVMASAYVSPDGDKIVAVFINMTHEAQNAEISINCDGNAELAGLYKTDERSDLAKIDFDSDSIKLAPRSITTAVWNVK